MRRNGVSEEDIRRALNRADLFVLDDEARPLLDKIDEEVLRKLEIAIGGIDGARRQLDAVFGDTSWNVPGWVFRALSRVPGVGKWLAQLGRAAKALQSAIQQLKDVLDYVAAIRDAVEAAKALADNR